MRVFTSLDDMRATADTAAASHITKRDIFIGGSWIQYRSYERASADPRGSETSCTVQNRRNKERGLANGWTRLGDDYIDNDKPASRRAKPGSRKNYERLIEDLRRDPGHVLVFFEMARGSRDLRVYLELRDLCEANGPYFWQVGESLYDVRDPGDRQALNQLASQAEGGTDNISRAVLGGMEQQVVRGRPHGQTLFGYRRVYHKATHDLIAQEIDDEIREGGWSPAGVVKEIFRDYRSGVPMTTIVNGLNERGVPTPRRLSALRSEDPQRIAKAAHLKWHSTMVFNILKNPHYIGIRMHRRILKNENAIWEGLVTQEDFFAVQERIKKRGLKFERPTKAQSLLTCLAECVCGEEVVHQSWKGKRPDVYRCRTGDSTVPRLLADAAVRAFVTSWLSDPAVIQRVTLNDSDEAKEAARRAEQLRAQLAGWKEDAMNPDREDVTREDYSRMAAQLMPKIREAEAKATRPIPDLLARTSGPDAHAKWDALPLAERRELLRLCVKVVLIPVGRGNRTTPIEKRIRFEPLF